MSPLELLSSNATSPMVLAFGLGIIAARVRSDLELPREFIRALNLYLLLAIGYKGGHALDGVPVLEVAGPLGAGMVISALLPLPTYLWFRKVARFGVADAAAMGAHYGSVSAITFLAATTFAERTGMTPEGYLPALLAAMELPGLVTALWIARRAEPAALADNPAGPLREILTGKSVFLLLGGLALGYLGGDKGYRQVEGFLVTPFAGVLVFYLLELGLMAGHRLGDARRAGWPLVAFGLVAPMLFGSLGAVIGSAVGLGAGGSMVFGTLAASASYIAAPATVRAALPEANPGYYLTAAVALTFPFNLVLGIPIYAAVARAAAG